MFTFGVPAPVKYALAVYANLEAENTQWILGLSCVFFFFFALSAGNATMWPISGGRFSHVGGLVGESELTFKTWTIRNSFLGFVVWASFSHRAILSLWVHIKALYKFGMLPLAKSSLPWRDTQQELVRIKKKRPWNSLVKSVTLYLYQRWGTLILEGHSLAELQPWKNLDKNT